MNVVHGFRLTRVLYEQTAMRGETIAAALDQWDEADLAVIAEYVSMCRSVVPKYVRMLADHLGVSPGDVQAEITGARVSAPAESHAREPSYVTYLPEDSADTSFYVSGFCKDRNRPT